MFAINTAIIFASIAVLVAVVSVDAAVLDAHKANSNEYCFSLPPALAPTYATFMNKYGQNGMAFLICMGPEWTKTCVDPVAHCMYTHDSQVECLRYKKCLGNDASSCAHYLQ